MPSRKKIELVNKIKHFLSDNSVVIATDYRGLSVKEITDLRTNLLEQGVEYHVIKNTLMRLAVQDTDKAGIIEFLEGPTAVACSSGAVSESAKVLSRHARLLKDVLRIKGGVMDGRTITPQDISVIATLPSREVLIAKVVGGMQSPIQSLVNVLNANLTGLLAVLQARARQLEGGKS